jgi:dinuclear metal center YbgI/SA1388 family protein
MKIKQIAKEIEKIAPSQLALDWDNVGLLVGDSDRNVKNILLTIDVTSDVVAEAKKLKADMILSYHPVIWDGLKTVTNTGPGSVVYELIREKICVYSIHTAFDIAIGGVNDLLAEIVGISDAEPIGDYVEPASEKYYKVTVFVPFKSVNDVAGAMFDAGAGSIGNYSRCSFQSEGTGTFLPLEGATPAIGKKGKLERVDEIKLESIVAANKCAAVVNAIHQVHPYETPAFDVFRHYDIQGKFGLGRIGKLAEPAQLSKITENIKKVTGAKTAGIIGKPNRLVKSAAVCAGSCGKIVNSVIAAGCDLYLTGELKHHQALAIREAGVTCICLSHTVSERFALKNLAKRLKKQLKDVTIGLSRKDTDPFNWTSLPL